MESHPNRSASFFNRAGTDDDSEELRREGFSREAFSAWLARGRKEKDGTKEEPSEHTDANSDNATEREAASKDTDSPNSADVGNDDAEQ